MEPQRNLYSLFSLDRVIPTATVNTVYVEPVSEDRAHKCLGRINLLIKIRRDVLVHPNFDDRLNQLAKVGPAGIVSIVPCICVAFLLILNLPFT